MRIKAYKELTMAISNIVAAYHVQIETLRKQQLRHNLNKLRQRGAAQEANKEIITWCSVKD